MAKYTITSVKTIDQLTEIHNPTANSRLIASSSASNKELHQLRYAVLSGAVANDVMLSVSNEFATNSRVNDLDANTVKQSQINNYATKLYVNTSINSLSDAVQSSYYKKTDGIQIATDTRVGGIRLFYNDPATDVFRGRIRLRLSQVEVPAAEQWKAFIDLTEFEGKAFDYALNMSPTINAMNSNLDSLNIDINNLKLQSDSQETVNAINNIAYIDLQMFGQAARPSYIYVSANVDKLLSYMQSTPSISGVLSIALNANNTYDFDKVQNMHTQLNFIESGSMLCCAISSTTLSNNTVVDSGTVYLQLGQISQNISSMVDQSNNMLVRTTIATRFTETDLTSNLSCALPETLHFMDKDQVTFGFNLDDNDNLHINTYELTKAAMGPYDGKVQALISGDVYNATIALIGQDIDNMFMLVSADIYNKLSSQIDEQLAADISAAVYESVASDISSEIYGKVLAQITDQFVHAENENRTISNLNLYRPILNDAQICCVV